MAIRNPFASLLIPPFAALLAFGASARAASECDGWQSRRPDWIFCDDFEKAGPIVAAGRYFEYNDNHGDFKPAAGTGLHGSVGMRTAWQAAGVDGGNMKLGFGRAPGPYFSKGIRTDSDFREIYYRMYMRLQKGWKGNPFKLSRATVIAKTDWSQAMIAHLWGDRADGLQLDPVRCADAGGSVKCNGYNDFANMQWIGAKAGTTPIYGSSFADKWICVEAHVRLNDPGQADGVHEFWIGDSLEARREGLNFLGGYKAFGINGVFFENYWNSGSPQAQERYFDNIVVSTKRIGCTEDPGAPTGLGRPRRTGLGEGEAENPVRRIGIAGIDADLSAGGGFESIRTLTGRAIPLIRPF